MLFFYCSSYLSTCQTSHTGDVSSIKRLRSLHKYASGNFRLSRALDKQLPVLLSKCIVYMRKKPAPLRTQQCYPAFLQEPQCHLLTAEACVFLQPPPWHPSLPSKLGRQLGLTACTSSTNYPVPLDTPLVAEGVLSNPTWTTCCFQCLNTLGINRASLLGKNKWTLNLKSNSKT